MHDHAADSGQSGLSELSIFVGNLIAEGHDDASIIRQLEARGFTQETAHRLLSVVRAKAETPVYVTPEPVTASALPGAHSRGTKMSPVDPQLCWLDRAAHRPRFSIAC